MLTLTSLLLVPPPVRAQEQGELYDIRYVWSAELDLVRQYKNEVVRVLGDHMERRLQVLAGDQGFGLIYDRNGDSVSTSSVAHYQTRLLIAQGLEPAVAVVSRDWTGSTGPSPTPTPPAPTPVPTPARTDALRSVGLEGRIDSFIQSQRRKGRVASDERTSWSVHDLTAAERLVGINEETPLQAASLIKPAFALAFLHEVSTGKLVYGPKSRRRLEAMIQHSDNRSTNWVLRILGGPRSVQRLLTRHYGHIFREVHVVEYIPRGGRTYRNKASAGDYTRFLEALWKNQLPHSVEIKRLMALPNPDRLHARVGKIPAGTTIYDKTGSTKHLCGNMGILQVSLADGRDYAYSLVAVIEKRRPARNYSRWIRSRGDLIREVSDIVHREMRARHLPPVRSAGAP